jgi:hypothetical protein
MIWSFFVILFLLNILLFIVGCSHAQCTAPRTHLLGRLQESHLLHWKWRVQWVREMGGRDWGRLKWLNRKLQSLVVVVNFSANCCAAFSGDFCLSFQFRARTASTTRQEWLTHRRRSAGHVPRASTSTRSPPPRAPSVPATRTPPPRAAHSSPSAAVSPSTANYKQGSTIWTISLLGKCKLNTLKYFYSILTKIWNIWSSIGQVGLPYSQIWLSRAKGQSLVSSPGYWEL